MLFSFTLNLLCHSNELDFFKASYVFTHTFPSLCKTPDVTALPPLYISHTPMYTLPMLQKFCLIHFMNTKVATRHITTHHCLVTPHLLLQVMYVGILGTSLTHHVFNKFMTSILFLIQWVCNKGTQYKNLLKKIYRLPLNMLQDVQEIKQQITQCVIIMKYKFGSLCQREKS